MTEQELDFFNRYSKFACQNNMIDQEKYKRYNVKRGLRNEDGTGVLVGLTEIGEVHGYVMDEGEKSPVEGRLRYRGYNVQDIVNACQTEDRFAFEEIAYLLLFGILPREGDLAEFKQVLGANRALPENFTEDMILKSPASNIMNKLGRSILAMYSYDDASEDTSFNNVLRQVVQLLAQFPAMVAYGYNAKHHYYHGESLFIHPPKPEYSTSENLLHMIRPNTEFTKLEAELLDLSFVLHAEHGGGNNSAFSIHVITSAETDVYAAVSAAVGSLKGAKHGGANIKVMGMMEDIKTNVKNWSDKTEVEAYLAKILKKDAFDKSGLIYGMGHAVYTVSDPRAVMLKRKAEVLAKEKGYEEEFALYNLIAELTPNLFREIKNNDKVICPNVDFYSGFVYNALNISPDLYTPLFAIGRMAGWGAHLLEEKLSGGRIIRPAYKSVIQRKPYVNLNERS